MVSEDSQSDIANENVRFPSLMKGINIYTHTQIHTDTHIHKHSLTVTDEIST